MEFYKEAKIIDLYGSTKLDLNVSGYNHKAFMVFRTVGSAPVKIYLNDRGSSNYAFTVSAPANNITGTVAIATNNISDCIIPMRASAVEITTGSTNNILGKIVLFN